MGLSKSKYCSAVICKKRLWLEENKAEEKKNTSKKSILDNGIEVGELAKNLFGEHIDIRFSENLKEMVELTKNELEKEKVVLTEASFCYENNFCSVDILKKDKKSFEIYEVKSSTEIQDIYIVDISYQFYILKMLGYDVKKAYIVYLNSAYVRKGELELDKLFNKEDVTNIVNEKINEIEKQINDINSYLSCEEQNETIGIKCFSPYDCPFIDYCTKGIKKPNVFNIKRIKMSKKIEYYNDNKISFEDLLESDIDDKTKEQIEFELYKKDAKIEKEKIKDFMKDFHYPIYFLDFETYQEAIPPYDDMSPYLQIPFQYSLHSVKNKNCKLKHKEYLSRDGIDPRRKLAEQLVKDIPLDACVVAYNMAFEKMIISNLANLYPDLGEHLMNIHDNIKDLMIPFKERWYYTRKMQGSYSIKYVLPALFPNDDSLNYKNLNIVHNGTEAMNSFKELSKLDLNGKEELRKALLSYCELDTYALVKIWELLKEL